MPRWVWGSGATALIFILVIYFFGGPLWSGLSWLFLSITHLAIGLFSAILNFLIRVFLLLLPALTYLVAFGVFLLSLYGVLRLAIELAKSINVQLAGLGKQIGELHSHGMQTGTDGAFLAVVAAFSALVAYMATDEFLNRVSSTRLFAACAMGLVVAKLFLFFSSRILKISGLVLMAIVLAVPIGFVYSRYGFANGFGTGVSNVHAAVVDPNNSVKVALISIIALLSLLTVLFPFTLAEWRRLLGVKRNSQA